MKRTPMISLLNPLPFWRRSARRISPLLTATVLLTAQNGWLLTLPAQADKLDGSGNAICAVPGQDGTVTSSGGQVNAYFPGASGVSVAAGATSITVGASKGAATPIKPGDLLLIIQMQGADIDSSNTGGTYGDGNAANNGSTGLPTYPADGRVNGNLSTNFTAGNFEYAVATNSVSSSGGPLNLSSPLVNSYTNADNTGGSSQGQKRFQVVRVPQYANLTVSGKITALPWDGSVGGMVAIDVAGKLSFTGSGEINVDGQGFRGGGGRKLSGDSGTPTLQPTDVVTLSSRTANASKGEGTAGTPKYLYNSAANALFSVTGVPEGYPNGSYGRGAPGNAGGGGTDDYPQTGNTAPDQYGNGRNTGGGGGSNGGQGGKGGYSWSTAKPYGGDGGAAFPASARRLVLGGGGGAGSTNDGTGTPNNGVASSGAAGGGIVMVRAGSVGVGTINANGATPSTRPDNDASGGGGAGGSVLVISQDGSTAGLTINAKGGNGGSNTGGASNPTPHGPGGGGGGGAIYASPGAATSLTGGSAGTTTGGVFGGATGGDGVAGPVSTSPTDAITSISGASCTLQAAKTTSTPGPLVAPGTATYTITASNPSGTKRAEARNVTISDSGLPAGFTHSAVALTPVYAGGASGPASVTSTGTASQPSWSGFTIPPGGSVTLAFTVNIANGTAIGKYNNSATADAKYINTSANVTTVDANAGAVTSTYDGTLAANTAEDVTIAAPSSLTVDKTVAIAVDSDGSGGTTPLANQIATPGDVLEYTITITNPTAANVSNVVFKDTIPANTTYVPGTLTIATGANSGSKTDASGDDEGELSGSQITIRVGTGASSTTGGTLGTTVSTKTSTVKFRVKINDPVLPSGTTQLSNQALVSSSGAADAKSNDPTTPAANDPTITKMGPRLRLVKRVTGIKKSTSPSVTSIGGYNDLAGDPNDNASGWFGGSTSYLLGAINSAQIPAPNPGPIAPNDEIEYTIYFLSDGVMAAGSVNLCDFIPANQTYVNGSMQLNFNGATTAIADGSGTGPGSGFYTSNFPASCQGINNGRGAAYFQIGSVTSVNITPATSYGFIRFRAKVN